MKLIRKINQNRRDFAGEYQCESCGNIEEIKDCYDDTYFHRFVTPDFKCEECGKSSNELGIKNNIATKYPDNMVV